MHRSALRLHSRDHDSSIRVACRSRAPCQDGRGPLRFYAQPLAPMSCWDSVEALALAITAGRYRPHLARSPHEVNLLGGFLFLYPRAHPGIAVHSTRPRHPERPRPRRIQCIASCAVALEGERRPIGPTPSRRLISAARVQYPFEINFPGSLKLQL